jgi:putative ABC transport system permease protein
MRQLGLLLRWSGRDLRSRWVQVGAIALIVALGSGFYSGLSSTSAWRHESYDASYAATHLYDLRLTLSTGSYLPADTLRAVARGIPDAAQVRAASTRLTGAIQVDASTGGTTIIVPGLVVGVDVAGTDGPVSLPTALRGRNLGPADAGRPVVLLDPHMARFYDLGDSGQLTLTGGRKVDYVGQGFVPESFVVIGQQGHEASAADFATVVTSLATAQDLLGTPGQANDLVLRLDPGADPTVVRSQIDAAMASAAPDVGYDWTTRAQDPARALLYRGVEQTQRLYTIFALLLLAGAAFGAFNLTVRIVEAQRREIGVAMALGTPPARIALRPALLGLEVAVLGAVLGVGVGVVLAQAFGAVLRDALPLPVWRTPFQGGVFAQGMALGVLVPLVAVVVPVWRAVRVAPIDAIRTTAVSAGGAGLSPALARLHLPGGSVAQMPVRNVLRSPRRSVLTALGIAATITVLVALLGLVDSFFGTIDVARTVVADPAGRRALVNLDRFHLADDDQVRAIRSSPVVGRSTTDIQVIGSVRGPGGSVDVVIELIDLRHGIWAPPLSEGTTTGIGRGLVLTTRAAEDLGVGVGDQVVLHHPLRQGLVSYTFTDTRVRVAGITPLPLRFFVFMDQGAADLLNLQGTTNVVTATRADGVTAGRFTRTLYGLPGVGSVTSPSTTVRAVTKQLDEILGILRIVDGALVLLAALIAFNSTSINIDERAREQATMFAFGVPLRSVLGVAVFESVITGVAGTLLGIGLGRLVLAWIVDRLLPEVVPDIGVVVRLGFSTIALAFGLGVLAVSVAPLLSYRRLARMDIPSTLRVME